MSPSDSLATLESGPSDAPTIVFLHGGGVGGWMWRPVMTRLAEWHCLAPDQPEHGASREVAPFTIKLAAAKVAELIRERAHDGRAIVIGLSQGAQVTVELLAQAGPLIDCALVSSALLLPMRGAAWVASPNIVRWAHRIAMRPLAWSDWWVRLNMRSAAGVPEEMFDEFARDFRATTEDLLAHVIVENQRFRMPTTLSTVLVRTLVIAGTREHDAMRRSARALVETLPNASGALLDLGPRASMVVEHNWALTRPDLFARTVRAWIDGGDLPRELGPLGSAVSS